MSNQENDMIRDYILYEILHRYPHLPEQYAAEMANIIFNRLDDGTSVNKQIDYLLDTAYAQGNS